VVRLVKLLSKSPDQTDQIGRRIGGGLSPGDIVAISGPLGSGKSVLARGILRALGVDGEIPSPSFVIVATYRGRPEINHIDLYRLQAADEALEIGIEDLLDSEAVNVIEWAEKIGTILPPARIDVDMQFWGEPDHRLVTISPGTESQGRKLLFLAEGLIREGSDEGAGD